MISAIIVYLTSILGIVRRRSHIITAILVLFCFFMAWLSNDQYDYINYQLAYEQVAEGLNTRFEIGYVWLMQLSNFLGLDYIQFRAIFSAGAILLILYGIRALTLNVNIPLSLGMIYPLIYLFPLQRFFMGAAIIIFATQYLILDTRSGTVKYLLLVFAAGLIHSSCFFFFIVPFVRLIKNKSNCLFVTFLITIGFIFAAETNILNRVVTLLPLGKSVENVLFSGQKANINGLIMTTVLLLLNVVPGFLSWNFYPKAKSRTQHNKTIDAFMDVIFYINVSAFYIVSLRVYSTAAERLLYIVALLNYMAVTNVFLAGKRAGTVYTKSAITVFGVGITVVLATLFWQLFVNSPHLQNTVFWMHFNTNPLFSIFNELLGG